MERVMEGDGWCVMEMQTLGREGWSRSPPQGTGWGRCQEDGCDPVWDSVGMGWCVCCGVAGLCGTSALGCSPWDRDPSFRPAPAPNELASGRGFS